MKEQNRIKYVSQSILVVMVTYGKLVMIKTAISILYTEKAKVSNWITNRVNPKKMVIHLNN